VLLSRCEEYDKIQKVAEKLKLFGVKKWQEDEIGSVRNVSSESAKWEMVKHTKHQILKEKAL
jgi:hypothetical protein